MIGSGGQGEPGQGLLQQLLAVRVERAEPLDLPRAQGAVQAARPRLLAFPGHRDPPQHRGAAPLTTAIATRGRTGQSGQVQPRHLHVHVDAVQQRTRDAPAIARNLVRRAMAATATVTQITAGTGIHGRHQLEARGKLRTVGRPGDQDASGLQRLPEHLQHPSVELRQFVQKQHPQMGQRDLPRPRIASPAHQGHPGGGVMGGAERPLAPGRRVEAVAVADGAQRGALQGLGLAHGR